MESTEQITILGAGVTGLTTALVLQGQGRKVKIRAKAFSPNTTSDVAPAIWYPEKIEPIEKTREWAIQAYKKFFELSKLSGSGVLLRKGRKLFHRPMGNPWWSEDVIGFKKLPNGYEFTSFVIDMSVYLSNYLMSEFKKNGGEFEEARVLDITEALEDSKWVINCTGFASRELVQDETLVSKRGQLVRIEKIHTDEFLLDTDHPEGMIYIVPRTNDCILGAVSEEGSEELNVNLVTSEKIIERCALYYPEIKTSIVLGHVVGLRPSRKPVRVETEYRAGGKILTHNYGHGGNGVTLSWGCAFEVAKVWT